MHLNTLCHGFSAGKQLVASCLLYIAVGNTNPLSLCVVLYCHVTTSTKHVNLKQNNPAQLSPREAK